MIGINILTYQYRIHNFHECFYILMVDTNTNIKWLIRICIFPNAAYCKYENSCGIANMAPYVRVRKEQTGKISPGTFFANQL